MTARTIGSLFAKDISRRIEEVIKVDQTDEEIIRDEISEYVVTDSIRSHYQQILDRYWETPNKPHEGIGVWVSGFFGSGKSSFAKFLGQSPMAYLTAVEVGGTRRSRTGAGTVRGVLRARPARHGRRTT